RHQAIWLRASCGFLANCRLLNGMHKLWGPVPTRATACYWESGLGHCDTIGALMIYTAAAGLASTLSFIVLLLMATWYVIPWMRSRSRADALTALLWVQAFRYIALQIFSAQKFGFAVSDGARNQIAAGDVTGMILALIAIVALRYRMRVATLLVWVFVGETVLDLVNATIAGIREELFS